MKYILLLTALLSSGALASEYDETFKLANKTSTAGTQTQPQIYLLVHGASGGAWDWKSIDLLLTSRGHEVYRPTLSGLGERAHLASKEINLTTHITDVVNTIIYEQLDQIILVGHSYGGMVITGVMNQVPEKIKHAIFLDAAIPNHGMSAMDLWPTMAEHPVVDGQVFFSWLIKGSEAPHDVPQSLATLTEPVAFDNSGAHKLPATFIPFIKDETAAVVRSVTSPSWKNALSRNWPVHSLVSDHNAQRSHRKELADLLELVIQPASK
ncbi:alpha/beta fold hydrolase [SAR92 clade bacterium H455]|uniref:Alpha/beta fold hydrolase n=1 Tax=SAR92 clade bacterium H455 TaxID=2974818 RepID=A0ABY5TPB8_9GAMM|nr:alpha/beta fold hydrolase [SAR92 clade bacterium H455]